MSDSRLTNEQLIRMAQNGDESAAELLVTKNAPLVHSIVRRFSGRGQEAEDLFQVGCIGLVKAVRKFDFSFGVKFSTYAVPMIMGEIKRFIRDDGIIKISRRLKDVASKAMAAKERITAETGREPSARELSEYLEISPEELAAALEAPRVPESIYASRDDGTHEGAELADRIAADGDTEDDIVDKMLIHDILEQATERERLIITMRYFRHKTQSQIAEMLGISQVQVSRLEKKILSKLRDKISGE